MKSPQPPESLDCTQCGACCQCFPIFAGVEDAARELRIAQETRPVEAHLASHERAYQLFPLPFLEACAFLASNQLCRIYPTRPDVCRRFTAGSPQCLEARQRVGFPSES